MREKTEQCVFVAALWVAAYSMPVFGQSIDIDSAVENFDQGEFLDEHYDQDQPDFRGDGSKNKSCEEEVKKTERGSSEVDNLESQLANREKSREVHDNFVASDLGVENDEAADSESGFSSTRNNSSTGGCTRHRQHRRSF